MGFGTNLRKLREAKNVSLRRFAMNMDISSTYLSKIEREAFPAPSAKTIQKIAEQLGIDGDLMAVEAGKIPEWMKDLMLTEGAACVAAMRQIAECTKLDEYINNKNTPRG